MYNVTLLPPHPKLISFEVSAVKKKNHFKAVPVKSTTSPFPPQLHTLDRNDPFRSSCKLPLPFNSSQ